MSVEPSEQRRGWRLAALAVGLSGPLVGAILAARWPLMLALGVHTVAAAAAWKLWRQDGPGGRDLGLVTATLAGCFPVVGSLGAWWVYGRAVKRESHLVEAYKTYIGRNWEVDRDLAPLPDARQALGRELAVLPLGDQLGEADLAGKQGAASALVHLEGATGVKILREALVHPADDTRLMASLALLKKEEALVAELKAARTHVEAHPDAAAHLALAQVARRYAESGLCAPLAAAALWRECVKAAQQAARGAFAGPARLMLATAHLALEEPAAALAAVEPAIAESPTDVAAQQLRLRALFALGRFSELAGHAEALVAVADPGSEAAAQAAFWRAHAR